MDFSKTLFGQAAVAELTYVSVYDEKATLPDPYYVFKSASSRLLSNPAAGVFTFDPAKKEATARISDFFKVYSGETGERPPSLAYFESYINTPTDQSSLRWLGLKNNYFARIDMENRLPCFYPPGEAANCTRVIRYANVGAQTLPGELKRTGSKIFNSVVAFSLARREKPSELANSASMQLSIDYAAKTVMGQWSVDGIDMILQGEYRPDLNTRLAGTVRSVDGKYSGTFVGDFYGPEGRELAIIFSAQGDDRGMAGRVVASL